MTDREREGEKIVKEHTEALGVRAAKSEGKVELRHLRTLTLPRRPKRPEANPYRLPDWIMWLSVERARQTGVSLTG